MGALGDCGEEMRAQAWGEVGDPPKGVPLAGEWIQCEEAKRSIGANMPSAYGLWAGIWGGFWGTELPSPKERERENEVRDSVRNKDPLPPPPLL